MREHRIFIVYAVVQSLTFAAGIAVILVGVRLFVGEIIPSFKGIADKLVPNAIPALDCPVLFTYSPNSVILGFVGMFAGIIFLDADLGAVYRFCGGSHNDCSVFSWSDGRNLRKLYWRNQGGTAGRIYYFDYSCAWAAGIHQVSGTSHYPGYYYVGGRDR